MGVISLIALIKTRAHNRGLAKEEQKQAVAQKTNPNKQQPNKFSGIKNNRGERPNRFRN
jgi:hypothetical protein